MMTVQVCTCSHHVCSTSSSSSVDQLDACHKPQCPIHCAKQIPITKQNQNKLINC